MTQQDEAGSAGHLDRVLADLRALSGDISSCAVLSAGDELLASALSAGAERERAAAMLAAVASAGQKTARREGKGHVLQLKIDIDEGHLLLVRLEGGGTLAATTGTEARVGLVLYDMRNARGEVEKALEGGTS